MNPTESDDGEALAVAFNNMLLEHRDDPGFDIIQEQRRSFIDHENGDWRPTPHAVGLIVGLNRDAMIPMIFSQHIESRDPYLIGLAQNFINVNGGNVSISGTLDNATLEAAHELASRPLIIPEGLEHDYARQVTMAINGQILLPRSPEELSAILSADELSYYQALLPYREINPGDLSISREQFLVGALIDGNPRRYQQFLDMVNSGSLFGDPAPASVPGKKQ